MFESSPSILSGVERVTANSPKKNSVKTTLTTQTAHECDLTCRKHCGYKHNRHCQLNRSLP